MLDYKSHRQQLTLNDRFATVDPIITEYRHRTTYTSFFKMDYNKTYIVQLWFKCSEILIVLLFSIKQELFKVGHPENGVMLFLRWKPHLLIHSLSHFYLKNKIFLKNYNDVIPYYVYILYMYIEKSCKGMN